MRAQSVTAILMAAGFSRRMGEDKLLLPFRGGTLISLALELVASIPFGQRLLVTTPARLELLTPPPGVDVVLNRNPGAGQSESVRLGVEAASGEAYMFFTADQPLLNIESVEWLLSHADDEHIVFPVVEGSPRSPTIFAARFRAELLAARGDRGGRNVRESHPDAVLRLPAKDALPFLDIDSREDYDALLREYGEPEKYGYTE